MINNPSKLGKAIGALINLCHDNDDPEESFRQVILAIDPARRMPTIRKLLAEPKVREAVIVLMKYSGELIVNGHILRRVASARRVTINTISVGSLDRVSISRKDCADCGVHLE